MVTHRAAAVLESDQHVVQRLLGRLRLAGYFGAQLNALLVPLLVFKLTGNAALAGAAMFIEWVPKLAFYLAGGSIVQRLGSPAVHVGLDAARLMAMGMLLAAALGHGSFWVVALAASVYQCANALSNILFERAVSRWWTEGTQAQGHAQLLQRDQMGSFAALALAMLVSGPALLAAAGVALQAVTVWTVFRNRHTVHQDKPTNSSPLATQLRDALVAVLQPKFLLFAITALLLALPAATFASAMLFFLQRAEPDMANPTFWMAALLLLRTALAVLALHFVQKQLARAGAQAWLAIAGFLLAAAAGAALGAPAGVVATSAALVLAGVAGNLYLPWMRTRRQELIESHVPEESRRAATGLMIAMEACSYLLGAALLVLFGTHLAQLALLVVALGAVGACLAVWRMRLAGELARG